MVKQHMSLKRKRFLYGFSIFMCICLLLFVWFIFFIDLNEPYDNPALIVNVDRRGVFLLDTYHGEKKALLDGVTWNEKFNTNTKIQNIINDARRDKVKYYINENGAVEIWYESDDGMQHLNKKIQELIHQ